MQSARVHHDLQLTRTLMNGWTANEDRHMAWYRGETIYDAEPEREDEDGREEPDEAEPDAEPEPAEIAAATRRYMKMSSRDRAQARLGSVTGCVVCQGEECWCAVMDRLADLACGHGVGAGICRGCLAELLVIGHRGSAWMADQDARRLVAAQRLRRRRGAA
jgi:hypothetical protein